MSCRVWSTFQATRNDGSLVKLRIQDLPENRIDDAVHLYIKYFIHEEKLMKIAGISRNPKAVKEFQSLISELIKDPASNTMICCEDEEEGNVRQIMGVSLMSLTTVERQALFKKLQPETDEMRLYLRWERIFDSHKQLKELQITSFYDDIGVIVHPRFRKLGIATEFARARRSACKAHNVAATCAVTTSIGTEKIAKKDYWDTLKEFKLHDLEQHYNITCEDVIARLVIWRNPEFKHDDTTEKNLNV
ncbi:uncharacterized protein LOC133517278 [Cydia pomonella]|uniref:uncharacterized protein LOC133517278 n=1 Tax=Cydia pomonella TaxID=82600 RepID=UPI002ADE7EFE|nr:uncharacterized protein LOC133517278 [Cydia pomonella]